MYIDYVRIYQEEGKESITCDPREYILQLTSFFWFSNAHRVAGYPTIDYIEKHARAYASPNFTVSFSRPVGDLGGELILVQVVGGHRSPVAQEQVGGWVLKRRAQFMRVVYSCPSCLLRLSPTPRLEEFDPIGYIKLHIILSQDCGTDGVKPPCGYRIIVCLCYAIKHVKIDLLFRGTKY